MTIGGKVAIDRHGEGGRNLEAFCLEKMAEVCGSAHVTRPDKDFIWTCDCVTVRFDGSELPQWH